MTLSSAYLVTVMHSEPVGGDPPGRGKVRLEPVHLFALPTDAIQPVPHTTRVETAADWPGSWPPSTHASCPSPGANGLACTAPTPSAPSAAAT